MNTNHLMSTSEAAQRWALSTRRVQSYCVQGRIPGAKKWGRAWMMPRDAACPEDGRRKAAAALDTPSPFTRESPLLTMTDILTRPGHADEASALLEDRQGSALFRSYLDYMRGNIDAAREGARRCIEQDARFYGQIGAATLLSLCAMHGGDEFMWNGARELIRRAPCRGGEDEDLRAFWLEAADSAIYSDGGYPEWFRQGNLDVLPADSQPAARFFYLKHLYLQCMNALREPGYGREESMRRIRYLPLVAEPLIAQTRLEGVFVSELYMRLICAISYHIVGDDARAIKHIDQAIALALPDRLYGPLAEYETNLDFLMDDRLRAADERAHSAVKKIHRRMSEGWVTLHNCVLARSVSISLTTRERETARLAAMGLNNQEIADRQHVSVSTVKQSLHSAMGKTGTKSRLQLAKFV